MNITICDKQSLLGTEAEAKIQSKVAAALTRFGSHINQIEVWVEDINGPKGGIDQECRIVVTLNHMKDVAVVVKCDSLSKAITQCIKRAERAVARSIDRRSLNSKRRSGLGVAFYQ